MFHKCHCLILFQQMLAHYVDIINKYCVFTRLNINAIHLKWYNNFTNDENGYIGVFKDMKDIRDGFKHERYKRSSGISN